MSARIPLSERPLWQQLNWVHVVPLTLLPALSVHGVLTTPLQTKTWMLLVFLIAVTSMGVTAGYHRYYAHRTYKATLPFQLFLAIAGTSAMQGSILQWCRDHRIHHRFTDTDKDPYNAKRGFVYSHFGWLLFKKDPTKLGRAEMDDLEADPIVMFQHAHFLPLSVLVGIVVPSLMAGVLWGDWRGGFVYCGVFRLTYAHHMTFLVNSLAHWLGSATYDDKLTPRDSVITALLTAGEGYHNFHHEFPNDYRNAFEYYQYDPTKWFIYACSLLGLTYDLKTFPDNEVRKGQYLMQAKQLEQMRASLDWGVPVEALPVLSFREFTEECDGGKLWIVIDDIVHDVGPFLHEHPGGIKYIRSHVAKDASAAFAGQVYAHSTAARNLMSSMRVARIA